MSIRSTFLQQQSQMGSRLNTITRGSKDLSTVPKQPTYIKQYIPQQTCLNHFNDSDEEDVDLYDGKIISNYLLVPDDEQ